MHDWTGTGMLILAKNVLEGLFFFGHQTLFSDKLMHIKNLQWDKILVSIDLV